MQGLLPIKIGVEVNAAAGIPKLIIIGLPSRTVTEAKERITTALQNCGIRMKAKRTIVNLAPADIRKNDSCLDLAIIASLLKEYGYFKIETDNTLFLGEVALDGSVRPIRAALPLARAAKEMGFGQLILPAENGAEIEHLVGIKIFPILHLTELLRYAAGNKLKQLPHRPYKISRTAAAENSLDDISGHHHAKRALMIAAAGGHNLLMTGPPGSGKSLLAKSISSLLPPLNYSESVEVSAIHSLLGCLHGGLMQVRPFRNPHHSTTASSLLGGGRDLMPGEISLAHHGVLFFDEINEFSRSTLEALREPLESGSITIRRSTGEVNYPSRLSLIAAANPCPCGYYGCSFKQCSCSKYQIRQYQNKLSGPLKDRIDMHLFIEPVDSKTLEKKLSENFCSIAYEKILQARRRQAERCENGFNQLNSGLSTKKVNQHCNLTNEALLLLRKAARNLKLSTRSYFSVIKVSQTIADLEGAELIERGHVSEAIQYRMLQ